MYILKEFHFTSGPLTLELKGESSGLDDVFAGGEAHRLWRSLDVEYNYFDGKYTTDINDNRSTLEFGGGHGYTFHNNDITWEGGWTAGLDEGEIRITYDGTVNFHSNSGCLLTNGKRLNIVNMINGAMSQNILNETSFV
jgi:hypothetical protein